MNLKKLGVLLGILAVVGGFWLWDKGRLQRGKDAREEARQVFTLTTDDVEKVEIDRLGEDRIVVVRGSDAAGEKAWRVTEPVQAAADESVVESMVATLLGAKKETVGDTGEARIISATPGEIAEFGLEPIETSVTLASATTTESLQLGLLSATESEAYARKPGEDRVFLVPKAVHSAGNRTLFDLRDKALVKLTNYKIDRIRIADPTREVEVRKEIEDLWRIVSTPVSYRAERGQISDFINGLNRAKVVSFVDEPADDHGVYGLTDSATVVTVWEGEARRTLRFGRHDAAARTRLYAEVEGRGEVVRVESTVLDSAPLDVEALRSADVFAIRNWNADRVEINSASPQAVHALTKNASGDWTLDAGLGEGPRPLEYTVYTKFYDMLDRMEAAGFVDDSSQAEALLAAPAWTITIHSERDGLTEAVAVSRLEKDTQTRYLRRNDSGALMMMYEEDLDEFRKGLDELLAARPTERPPMTGADARVAPGDIPGATP